MKEFLPPTVLQGTDTGKIAALYSYLNQMSRQLNVALQNIGPENFKDPALKELAVNASGVQTAAQAAAGYSEIKSLIVKTADSVTVAMDTIRSELASYYLAESTYGTFEQYIAAVTTATAHAVVTDYEISEGVTLLDQLAEVMNYQIDSSQYIKTGLLYYEDSIPRVGVAVGEDVTTITVDGHEVVNRAKLLATFTSDALTFWHNDIKVAWVSNNQLYINEINVVSKVTMGSKWQIDHQYGFTIRWVG